MVPRLTVPLAKKQTSCYHRWLGDTACTAEGCRGRDKSDSSAEAKLEDRKEEGLCIIGTLMAQTLKTGGTFTNEGGNEKNVNQPKTNLRDPLGHRGIEEQRESENSGW
ncbi:hypothetical protein NDU88_007364 [Pleurodeles waltl]|uniref:Uncharacterized protein n=1 Tax=Pleurodeles waltl TaxID=8319 RepID=A0AAV7PL53_PLEWA|nr:hypothetical protein NDU88_007364 [Pleurodeles waltl]